MYDETFKNRDLLLIKFNKLSFTIYLLSCFILYIYITFPLKLLANFSFDFFLLRIDSKKKF